jgi:uncharacterized protein (DUF2141 family)
VVNLNNHLNGKILSGVKRVFGILILVCCSLVALSQNGTLVVTVSGIDINRGGDLSVGIFDEENFPKAGRHLLGLVKSVSGARMKVVFEKVPEGAYGIAVFQDTDKNKMLKTNFLGFPIEPFGFSNDARPKLGPPSFQDAQIIVEAGKVSNLTITLR